MTDKTAEGTRVHVFSADKATDLGHGTYQGEVAFEDGDPSFTTPKILLDSGQEILGCECWWSHVP